MDKKGLKQLAQSMHMDSISKTYYAMEKMNLTEEDKTALSAELKRQADRVAKLFGYSQSWTQ